MTDPVILLGTQSNGETLPVQVNQFGQLVAEGLQGPPGPEGPSGTCPDLPPDPYEGALLGWLNGGLAWIGSEPVPIPPGSFGPIKSWDANTGIVGIQGAIPDTIGNGVYLRQIDEYGIPFCEDWIQSVDWATNVTATTEQFEDSISRIFTPEVDINSSAFQYFTAAPYTMSTVTFDPPIDPDLVGTAFEKIKVAVSAKPGGDRLTINGTAYTSGYNDTEFTWIDINSFRLSEIQVRSEPGQYNVAIGGIMVDDQRLITPGLPITYRVNQVMGDSLLGNVTYPFNLTVGKLFQVVEQKVAPWVLYGNDPTSLIDHLRRTRD